MRRIFLAIKLFLRDRFALSDDKDNEGEIVSAIRKSVAFKGINLWLLIFAILIASVGLNVNSTAVVIGAMLISPLMGPIMGLGLGAGINDLDLVGNAAKNLAIAVVFSVLTSAIYFYFTPIQEAQSELLSRTSPTFWDVLIALFGGLAGVFAGSSKEKGNAIPGVAIATALMPPLCTAGYGLATLNMNYLFGALYLFFINSVMIGSSTYVVVQFLNFKKAEYLDEKRSRLVKRTIYILVILTVLPSLYLGYNIVRRSAFEIQAKEFINKEFNHEEYYVVKQNLTYKNRDKNIIDIYIGGYMDSLEIIKKRQSLLKYNLENNTILQIKQGNQLFEVLEKGEAEKDKINLQHANELNLRDSTISLLNKTLIANEKSYFSTSKIAKELNAFYPNAQSLSINDSEIFHKADSSNTSVKLILLETEKKVSDTDFKKIQDWLKVRLNTNDIKLILNES